VRLSEKVEPILPGPGDRKFFYLGIIGDLKLGSGGIGGENPRVTRAAQFSRAACVHVCVWLKTHVYHLSMWRSGVRTKTCSEIAVF
jgi:hypothetical protein